MKAYEIGRRISRTGADWRWYRMEPPLDGHEHVVVSAVVAMFSPETYIFPATPDGDVTDWGELPESQRGILDHAAVLLGAGYAIAPPPAPFSVPAPLVGEVSPANYANAEAARRQPPAQEKE